MSDKKYTFEEIVNHLVTSGFVYKGSEIYGGLANSWDYGPLGTLLKNHVKDVTIYDINDSGAAVASGSFKVDNYIIAPASMGFVGRVANGISSNLAERCADVAIKERRPLVILFREMPLSNIHLENLLKLNNSGAITMPAAPGFYHKVESINDLVDFVSGKVLDILSIENNCFKRWKS